MVQKKNAVKGKQQTPAKLKGKKAAEDDNMDNFFDMDSDDSESEQVMKKTPGAKTPKGKQSQGDKRVSFQIPGKNTPKTPKTDNSVIGKKQLTPGKPTALKEFQGMLANTSAKKNDKQKKKQAEGDNDEDDDDEEDDDDDDDDDADLDMLVGGIDDDDDDDDDDDEDDDDDDEEDDDEEEDDDDDDDEEKTSPKKKQNQTNISKKQASVVEKKTPLKAAFVDKNSKDENKANKSNKSPPKGLQTLSKSASPLKSDTKNEKSTGIHQKALELAAEQRRERDVRTLFIGNLPLDITQTELKALSSDIINVSLPSSNARKRKTIFAFLEFANESKAEENYNLLKSKKIRGHPFAIDYTGTKRKNVSEQAADQNVNLKRLYVSSLPIDATIDKIAKFFPKAIQIMLNNSFSFRNASVFFSNEDDAAEALAACKTAKIDGKPITVLYSTARDRTKKRKRSKPKNVAAKKLKLDVKESDDDDDDDSEEEE